MPADVDTGDHSHAQPGSDFTRLHITPFDSDLLNIVIPASVRPSARNISFHSVQTFPERRFGYVDVPTADAEKLKNKLNGSVLKGTKMRIQDAAPEERIEPGGFDEEATKKKDKKHKKKSEDKPEGSSKKRKRDDNVVRGVVLTDRKVQRGWTEAPDYKQKKQKRKEKSEKGEKDRDKEKEKKKRTKSKYTEKEECLLKTVVPPNAMKNLPEEVVQDKKRKKKKGGEREVTIHEFEKTTKFPSFLKASEAGSSRKAATDFVEGKGWVDEDGNVVEAAKVARPEPKAPKKTPTKAPTKPKAEPVEDSDDETSSSGTSSDGSSDDDSEAEEEPQKEDVDMSSDTSSEGGEEADDKPAPQLATPKSNSTSNRPTSSGSVGSLKLQIPPADTPPQEVHPLEALYKKKKAEDGAATPAKEPEPFTFFGGNDENEDDDESEGAEEDGDERMDHSTPMPMTPYSRQDLEERTIRSAAPTPDTAHPTRMRNIWGALHKNDEDLDDLPEIDGADEEDEDENDNTPAGNAAKDTGDFQSWFWENRGDLNRSWMKRRKMAAKEKRHRENKVRASRAV